MLNKVPEVTAVFWIIKVLATTVGETFADFLNINLNLGYLLSLVVFAAAIAVVALAYCAVKLYAVVALWIAHILTRPLGASTGDLLSQSPKDGGVGLGTTGTSVLFPAVILLLVVGLSIREQRGGVGLDGSTKVDLPTA